MNRKKKGAKLCFSFNTVSESYMRDISDKLNPRKAAAGCDFISLRLLHLSAPAIT